MSNTPSSTQLLIRNTLAGRGVVDSDLLAQEVVTTLQSRGYSMEPVVHLIKHHGNRRIECTCGRWEAELEKGVLSKSFGLHYLASVWRREHVNGKGAYSDTTEAYKWLRDRVIVDTL